MDLTRSLLKAFSDVSKPETPKTEQYLYATAKVDTSGISVMIDGSNVYSPVETTAEIKNGERVMVTVNNHVVTVVGNMSSPAARVGTVEEVEKTAEDAKTNSNKAIENAKEAKKQATNFIEYDETGVNGLILADKTNGEFKGFRSQLLSDRYNILNEEDIPETSIGAGWARIGKTSSNNIFIDDDIIAVQNNEKLLASFAANEVKLGIASSGDANVKISSSNNKSSIDLCYGVAKMEAVEVDTNDWQGSITKFMLLSNDVMLIDAPKQMTLTSTFEDADVGHSFWTRMHQQTAHMGDPFVELAAGREMGDVWDEYSLSLTSYGLSISDFLGETYFRMYSVDGINFRSETTFDIYSIGNINITTENGAFYVNDKRVMHAVLPEGGYWGMVVPTGTDTNFIRTTVSGLIPYAQENTSKIGTASYRFSEGNFDTLRAHTSLCTGSKMSATGNATGAVLANTGRLFLQNTTGNSYVQFYGPSTDKGCYISYNIETERLMFGGAGVNQFSFGQKIYTSGTIQSDGAIYSGGALYAGYGSDWSTARGIYMPFKDETNHSVVYRDSDGLTIYYGWGGSSTNKSVAILRGYTVKYHNSSGATALSDERLKKDFESLDRWDGFFDSIEPCAFKMKTGSSGRYHIGFKARQIEEALLNSGLSTTDFAGFMKMPYRVDPESPELAAVYEEAGIKPGDDEYGLIYSEFTALNTYEIQKLKKEVAELKALIKEKNNETEIN